MLKKLFYKLSFISICFVVFFISACNTDINPDAEIPIITNISSDLSTTVNTAVSLSIEASVSDEGTLSYQWYSATANKLANGSVIEDEEGSSGAATAIYKPSVSTTGVFYYYCVITNTLGASSSSVISPRISVTIKEKVIEDKEEIKVEIINAKEPVIEIQPCDIKAIIPASGNFTIGASSPDGGSLTYQWYQVCSEGESDILIEGETDKKLSLSFEEAGTTKYYCEIKNTIPDNGDGGTKTASIKTETVSFEAVYLKDAISSYTITETPVTLHIANPKASFSFGVSIPGYNVKYQWYESSDGSTNTGSLITATEANGADTTTFTTPDFTEKGIHYYYCSARIVIYEGNESNPAIELELVKSPVVSVAVTGLPTLYIETGDVPTSSITRDAYVLGSMKIVSAQYGNLDYIFTKTDKDTGNVKEGIKGRGNSSWGMPKKGYNIKFDSKKSVLGMPADKKWCIIANYSDKTLLRNKYASVLGNEIYNCEWNPNYVFVDVIMNGEYLGNYIFGEKNTISEDRIDIQDITDCTQKKIKNGKYVDKNGDSSTDYYDGGFVMEIDNRRDADFYFTSTKGVSFTLKDPDEVTEEILEHIKSVVQRAEDTLYADDFDEALDGDSNQSKWMQYCDIDSFIDWYFVNEIGKNRDACFSLSVYMYYNPVDGKLHLGPNWDFDPAFGNDGENGGIPSLQSSTDWYIKGSKWISRMFEDPLFVSKIKERWNEKKAELLETFAVNGTIKNLADEIKISADLNFMKWPILGSYVWPNPTGWGNRTTYQSEIDYMKNWLQDRYTWLDTNINALQ